MLLFRSLLVRPAACALDQLAWDLGRLRYQICLIVGDYAPRLVARRVGPALASHMMRWTYPTGTYSPIAIVCCLIGLQPAIISPFLAWLLAAGL